MASKKPPAEEEESSEEEEESEDEEESEEAESEEEVQPATAVGGTKEQIKEVLESEESEEGNKNPLMHTQSVSNCPDFNRGGYLPSLEV